MFCRSLSESFSGDSIAIFIKEERLLSPMRFLNRVSIIFIYEKLISIEAVPTGIERQIFLACSNWGTLFQAFRYLPILLTVSSYRLLVFWQGSGERFSILYGVHKKLELAYKLQFPGLSQQAYLPHSDQVVSRLHPLHKKIGQKSQDLVSSWSQILKHETTSCEAKRLEMLLFKSLTKGLANLSWKELMSSIVAVVSVTASKASYASSNSSTQFAAGNMASSST